MESRLSEAFWKAVSSSLEESDDEVMYTALEYPSSGAVLQIMYGSGVALMVFSGRLTRLSPLFLYHWHMAGNRLLSLFLLANPLFPFYSRRL
jgi:hypothetical protein